MGPRSRISSKGGDGSAMTLVVVVVFCFYFFPFFSSFIQRVKKSSPAAVRGTSSTGAKERRKNHVAQQWSRASLRPRAREWSSGKEKGADNQDTPWTMNGQGRAGDVTLPWAEKEGCGRGQRQQPDGRRTRSRNGRPRGEALAGVAPVGRRWCLWAERAR